MQRILDPTPRRPVSVNAPHLAAAAQLSTHIHACLLGCLLQEALLDLLGYPHLLCHLATCSAQQARAVVSGVHISQGAAHLLDWVQAECDR